MTLLGKILTVLIFIMSVVFMSFAVMVFSTHKDWKAAAMRLEQEADVKENEYNTLKDELDRLRLATERERAARAQALAALESRRLELQDQLNKTNTQLADKTTQLQVALEAARTAENQLAGLTNEVETLREEIRTVLGQRDKYFEEVVAMTDQVHQMQDKQRQLTETRNDLLAENSRYKLILDRNGLDADIIPRQPPDLKGYIAALSQTNKSLVEVSLGSDDGLRTGHYLEVSRDGEYVGRLAVVRVSSDRAVGQILDELLRKPMQRGDIVRTKVN